LNIDLLYSELKNRLTTFGHIEVIYHFAANPGVRNSIIEPLKTIQNNICGTAAILEIAKELNVPKFIFASSSSVYGNTSEKCKESDKTDLPLSPYASSKKAAEMLCYNYFINHSIDISVLRLFTVIGNWGRPDMASYQITKSALCNLPFYINGDGNQARDFTFVEDIVDATLQSTELAGFNILNISGGNKPISLLDFIEIHQKFLKREIKIIHRQLQKSESYQTWADISKTTEILNWQQQYSIDDAVYNSISDNDYLNYIIKN